MLRLPLLLPVLLLLAGPAQALDWAIGANVVGSNSSFTGDLPDDGKWEGRGSLGAGVILDLAFTDDVVLSFQPTWTPRGGVQRIEKNGIILSSTEFDLEYLSMPLLLRVTSDPGRVRGFVTAGVTVAYLLAADSKSEGVSEDVEALFDEFTVGAMFGAGALIAVRGQQVILELRYEQGLEDIVDRSGPVRTDVNEIASVKYREIRLSAGILFGAGGQP